MRDTLRKTLRSIHWVLLGASVIVSLIGSLSASAGVRFEPRFEGDAFLSAAAVELDRRAGRFAAIHAPRSGDDGVLRCELNVRLTP